jgi:hypothetical protein
MLNALPLFPAEFGWEIIPVFALLIPITALMIPIVAIWTGHKRSVLRMKLESQERMVQAGTQGHSEIQELRAEVNELRDALHAQVITMDSLISQQAKLLKSRDKDDDIHRRLGGGEPEDPPGRTMME